MTLKQEIIDELREKLELSDTTRNYFRSTRTKRCIY